MYIFFKCFCVDVMLRSAHSLDDGRVDQTKRNEKQKLQELINIMRTVIIIIILIKYVSLNMKSKINHKFDNNLFLVLKYIRNTQTL